MARKSHILFIASISFLVSMNWTFAQTIDTNPGTSKAFSSLEEVLAYTTDNSISLKNQEIKMEQAKKAKLAAVLGTIDVTGALLNAQLTDNTTLGVNLFPAEIFGGEPGTFKEVQMGVQYNTNLTNYADVKLVNPTGWSNLKLSKINILLTSSTNQISLKNLQENIAKNYYNIVNLQEQIGSSQQHLAIADTLYHITQNKFAEGLVKQQDVNDSKVNWLNSQENLSQLEYLLEQYYISLKLLCDIPEHEQIEIRQVSLPKQEMEAPNVLLNELQLRSSILQQQYAKTAYKSAKATFLPTLSLQLSNSNNLYNTEFKPLSGNWINSNYIGVNLSIPIPSSQRISQKYNAQYDYQMAINNTEQAEIQAGLTQQSLQSEYEQAVSQARTNQEILSLREDSFKKNQQLYQEGLISLEVVLNSFNSMVSAEYNLISSEVNVELTRSNININNTIR
ncbi:MAG: TolC family protein [Bacteroidota bacterium]